MGRKKLKNPFPQVVSQEKFQQSKSNNTSISQPPASEKPQNFCSQKEKWHLFCHSKLEPTASSGKDDFNLLFYYKGIKITYRCM